MSLVTRQNRCVWPGNSSTNCLDRLMKKSLVPVIKAGGSQVILTRWRNHRQISRDLVTLNQKLTAGDRAGNQHNNRRAVEHRQMPRATLTILSSKVHHAAAQEGGHLMLVPVEEELILADEPARVAGLIINPGNGIRVIQTAR